jgi:hypothetical protein
VSRSGEIHLSAITLDCQTQPGCLPAFSCVPEQRGLVCKAGRPTPVVRCRYYQPPLSEGDLPCSRTSLGRPSASGLTGLVGDMRTVGSRTWVRSGSGRSAVDRPVTSAGLLLLEYETTGLPCRRVRRCDGLRVADVDRGVIAFRQRTVLPAAPSIRRPARHRATCSRRSEASGRVRVAASRGREPRRRRRHRGVAGPVRGPRSSRTKRRRDARRRRSLNRSHQRRRQNLRSARCVLDSLT